MKKTLIILFGAGSLAIIGCNNKAGEEKEIKKTDTVKTDTAGHVMTRDEEEIKAVSVVFTNVDKGAASSLRQIVDHYLHIKNGLANDDSKDAAAGAKEMKKALAGLDKSLLTAEQKTAYDRDEEELKEHAEHIASNAGDIEHQRSHFAGLSEVIYSLVKNFGAGREVYHDHCPMARDNQGAMWISELREVKNPYFGAQMPKCGTVEEVIK